MISLQDQDLLKTAPYVNGEWVSCAHTFTVSNPAAKYTIEVGDAPPELAVQAIEAAKAGFSLWRSKSVNDRAFI